MDTFGYDLSEWTANDHDTHEDVRQFLHRLVELGNVAMCVPVAMGSGRTALHHKLMALLHQIKLFVGSEVFHFM